MVVLVAQYTALPGTAEAMTDAFERMERAVRETERGCRTYRVSQPVDDPERWIIYEEYVDDAAFAAHRVTPHFKAIIEGEMAAWVLKRERQVCRLVVPAELLDMPEAS